MLIGLEQDNTGCSILDTDDLVVEYITNNSILEYIDSGGDIKGILVKGGKPELVDMGVYLVLSKELKFVTKDIIFYSVPPLMNDKRRNRIFLWYKGHSYVIRDLFTDTKIQSFCINGGMYKSLQYKTLGLTFLGIVYNKFIIRWLNGLSVTITDNKAILKDNTGRVLLKVDGTPCTEIMAKRLLLQL